MSAPIEYRGLAALEYAAQTGAQLLWQRRPDATPKVIDALIAHAYEGKPLEHGTISFTPTDGQRPSATATIQSGSYTLQTTDPGDGAVVGEYKVAISDINPDVFSTDLPGAPVKVSRLIQTAGR